MPRSTHSIFNVVAQVGEDRLNRFDGLGIGNQTHGQRSGVPVVGPGHLGRSRIRTNVLLVSSLLAVAACTAGPPSGYADAVCSAYQAIAGTSADWTAMGEAAGASDVEAMGPLLDRLETATSSAVDSLADAPEWEPGDPLYDPLVLAAGDYDAAVRLFRDGLAASDAAKINQATEALGEANDQLGEATDALPAVQEAGLDC